MSAPNKATARRRGYREALKDIKRDVALLESALVLSARIHGRDMDAQERAAKEVTDKVQSMISNLYNEKTGKYL